MQVLLQKTILAHLCYLFNVHSPLGQKHQEQAQAVWGCCRAELKQAGSYAVRVGTQGHMLPGWPQALHVQPCAADTSQCWLSGAALQVCSLPCCPAVRDALLSCDFDKCFISACTYQDAPVL